MMSATALEAVLRRDRWIVAASLAALTMIAWAYIFWLARSMYSDDTAMQGMDAASLDAMMMSGFRPWTMTELAVTLLMWMVMMIGMMTPSAAPMILLYARVGRHSEVEGKPLAATGFFLGGYFLAWMAFACAATLGQWALESTLLLTPMMTSASGIFSGIMLIAVGLFQWTPLKDICLRQCQAPVMFIHRHGGFRRDPRGSVALGFRHGMYCVGCCWALMGLLFIGGVMNVLWIAAVAIFVLAEKLVARGRWFSRLSGLALCAAGLWLLGAAIL
ncbi:DUF2182 domain-containing protein [Phyllobacterium myrsinacearum]|uniref:DUF2182 domain-containing protein n=1 Tax=Phyllobacterium myrsinacearum TaxID=28101 RepID=UPI0013EE73E9|nr:DUF2182 domain-containing protein [Phyllobacterium myrsinacearum]